MYDLIRYTTPTFIFDPQGEYQVSEVENAALTLVIKGEEVISKPFTDAIVDTVNNLITWTLTQQETGALHEGDQGYMTVVILRPNDWRGESNPVLFIVRNTTYGRIMS